MATEYLDQSPWHLNGMLYYDWLVRDFFAYMIRKANTHVSIPGSGELMWLGDDWRTRAESAYSRSVNACEYEELNLMLHAGDKWQKVFGTDIPK